MKMEKIKLVYQGAFAIPDAEEACVVTLTDAEEERALSIVTDKPMANEIKFRQLDKDVKHPHLVDVLARMICEQGPQAYHVVFEANGNIGPKAKLVNATSGSAYSLLRMRLSCWRWPPVWRSLPIWRCFRNSLHLSARM